MASQQFEIDRSLHNNKPNQRKLKKNAVIIGWLLLVACLVPVISAAELTVTTTDWVAQINNATSGDTILMQAGTYTSTSAVSVSGKTLSFIAASGSNDVLIQRPTTAGQSIFTFTGAFVSFTGIEFDGQDGSASCVAVTSSSLNLFNVSMHDCRSTGYGGAILISSASSLLVASSTFTSNAASRGGAIYIYDNGNADLTDCSFTNNSSPYAGAVFNNGNANLTDCSFTNNTASSSTNSYGSYGGAMYIYGNAELVNCIFLDNTAISASHYGGGGAVFIFADSNVNLTNCSFTSNKAGDDGGGAFFLSVYSNAYLTDCTFTSNTDTFGGALVIYGVSGLTGCTFTSNSAAHGGAIRISKGSEVNLTGCTFTGNVASTSGGALYITHDANAHLTDCIIANSTADYGGAIYIAFDNFDIIYSNTTEERAPTTNNLIEFTNTTISRSNATNNGGGIYVAAGTASFTGCAIGNNWAQGSGGGAYFAAGQSSWSSVIFDANRALMNGNNCFVQSSGIFNCSSCIGCDCLNSTMTNTFVPPTTTSTSFTTTTTTMTTTTKATTTEAPVLISNCSGGCPTVWIQPTNTGTNTTWVVLGNSTEVQANVSTTTATSLVYTIGWGVIREVGDDGQVVRVMNPVVDGWSRTIVQNSTAAIVTYFTDESRYSWQVDPLCVSLVMVLWLQPGSSSSTAANNNENEVASAKLSLNIEGKWDFTDASNTLEVVYTVRATFQPFESSSSSSSSSSCDDQKEEGELYQVTEESGQNVYWFGSVDNSVVELVVPTECTADDSPRAAGILTPVFFAKRSAVNIILQFPWFGSSLYYNSNLAVLLRSRSEDSCVSLFQWTLPAVFLAGVAVLVVGAIILFHFVQEICR